MGLGFLIQGLGFRVKGLDVWVYDLVFGVYGWVMRKRLVTAIDGGS